MWVVLAASVAGAQQATVQSTGVSYPSLQEAVDNADPADTVTVSGALVGNTVVIAGDLTIVGDGTGSYTSPATAIETVAGSTVVIEDLEVVSVGGSAVDASGVLELRDVALTGNADFGGGVRMQGPSLVAERVTITDATALTSGGGMFLSGGVATVTDLLVIRPVNGAVVVAAASLVCTRCTFVEATGTVTAVSVTTDGALTLIDTLFDHPVNTTGFLAAAVDASAPVDILRATFCGAEGAYTLALRDGGVVRNSRFVENAVSAELLLQGGTAAFTNNDFLGSGGLAINARNGVGAVTSVDNLFHDYVYDPLFEELPGLFTDIGYNAFDVVPVAVTLGIGNLVGADPGLRAWSVDSDCGNDDLRPLQTSVLIDAGDPALHDPDGSRSDIGATGGPGADPALHADLDGDGISASRDCDDLDEALGLPLDLYPDGDGDGVGTFTAVVTGCPSPGWVPVFGDCDDEDASVWELSTFYRDADTDGFGDPSLVSATEGCRPDAGWVADGTDCDDGDAAVHAIVDQYPDADGDGWGVPGAVQSCGLEPGFALTDSDCDDTLAAVNPGAAEICDAVDQNCTAGDEPLETVHVDEDGDGFGVGEGVEGCVEAGWAALDGDCDDTRTDVWPGAPELCDDVDQDCDGQDDDAPLSTWYPDADGDGYGAEPGIVGCPDDPAWVEVGDDCDDAAPEVNPGVAEVCNAVDDDCSGAVDDLGDPAVWFTDADGDGQGDPGTERIADCAQPDWVSDGSDCDDADPDRFTGAREIAADGLDQDCDGFDNSPQPVGACAVGATGGAGWWGVLGLVLVGRRRR